MYSDDFSSFEPKYFLDLAHELYENRDNLNSNSSAIERTTVSRTYYATFLHVLKWLEENTDYKSNGSGDHTKIPNYIYKNLQKPMKFVRKDIRDKLITLKYNRVKCDYYFEIPDKNNQNYNLTIEDLFKYAEYILKFF